MASQQLVPGKFKVSLLAGFEPKIMCHLFKHFLSYIKHPSSNVSSATSWAASSVASSVVSNTTLSIVLSTKIAQVL